MLNKKRLMAMAMTSAMVLASLAGCSKDGGDGTTEAPKESSTQGADSTEAPTEAPTEEVPTEEQTQPVETLPGVEAGQGINFEDGLYGFVGLDEGKADFDEVNLSVVEYAGSKALRVESVNNASGKSFYLGFDLTALLGEKVADVAKIKLQVGVEAADNEFHACGFTIAPTHKAASTSFTVYTAKKNPREVELDITEPYSPDERNVFVLKKLSDTAGNDKDVAYQFTDKYSVVYIDNIQFLDANGNPIEVASTDVAFEAPTGFGALDWSNLTSKPYGEVDLGIGGITGTGWWPEAHNSFQTVVPEEGEDPAYTLVDASLFKPGTVLTVYFECEPTEWQVPYLRAQVLDPADSSKVINVDINPTIEKEGNNQVKDEDGTYGEGTRINNAFNIIQFTYEELLAAFEAAGFTAADFANITFMGVADQSVQFTVLKVTIGTVAEGEVTDAGTNANSGSSTGWGQAVVINSVNDGGTLDLSNIGPGWVFVADYTVSGYDPATAENAPVELILQSWTDGRPEGSDWCKVVPTTCNETQAAWSYEDMVAAFGTEDLASFVNNLCVGDCGVDLNVSNYYFIAPSAE